MKISEVKPEIRQFRFLQEKSDSEYGLCLWADFTLDCKNYTLLIDSDCGSYTYGWTPTPDAESFVHLMSRINKEYLLGKIAEKSHFDIEASIEQTIDNIRAYYDEDEDEEYSCIPDVISQEIKDLYDHGSPEMFFHACEELIERECDELSPDTFEIISVVTDYTAEAKRIAKIFRDCLQPLLKQEVNAPRSIGEEGAHRWEKG